MKKREYLILIKALLFVWKTRKKELWDSLESYTVVQSAFHCGCKSMNDMCFELGANEESVQKIHTVLKICEI